MNPSTFNPGRYARLALLLVMLAAQMITVAHEPGEHSGLKSDACSTCIIGHGLGNAVSASHEVPPLQLYRPFVAAPTVSATPTSRTNGHLARAPPLSYRNT